MIDQIASEPTVRGIKLVIYWGAVEGAQGDYSAGFAIVDAYLEKLRASNKYLILSIQDRIFGGHAPATINEYFPAYIVKSYGMTPMHNRPGTVLRVWQAQTMDREIAMSRAFAARYNAHPNFEMFQVEETAIPVAVGKDGYSLAGYGTQIRRLMSESAKVWTKTLVRVPANFFGSDTQMLDLMTYAVTFGIAFGGPDIIPNQTIQADRIYMARYMGTMPWVVEVQSPSLGGHEGTFTAKQIYDSGMLRKPSHFVWYRNTWSGGAAQRWDTGLLPYIRSVKGVTVSSCPRAIRCSP